MIPSTMLGTSPAGLRHQSQSGITLLEVVIAATLLGVVFVAAIALQISSLGFLKGQMNAPDVNAAIAFEQMVRDVKRAHDVDVPTTTPVGQQLKLKIDTADPPDSTLAGDLWIVYGIVGGKLRWKAYTTDATGPASSASDVIATDPEVLNGLDLKAASNFSIVNPPAGAGNVAQVKINLTVQGTGSDVTFTTSVLPSRSK